MVFKVQSSCGSFVGNGRSHNEDNFYFHNKHLPVPNQGLKNPMKWDTSTEEPVVFALFDGLGGEHKGEEAACVASQVLSRETERLTELAIPGRAFLHEFCEKANAAVNDLRVRSRVNAAGTTVAALYLSQDEAVACNVGDSRIYRIRGSQMLQISEDHTDEKIMAAIGVKKKPVLLQYLGVPDTEMTIEPYISKGDIQPGDMYVLCSDGVTDVLDENTMYDILRGADPYEAVRRLLAEVDKRDGGDNATVIVIKMV